MDLNWLLVCVGKEASSLIITARFKELLKIPHLLQNGRYQHTPYYDIVNDLDVMERYLGIEIEHDFNSKFNGKFLSNTNANASKPQARPH
jgi:hypothetical protein